MPAGQLGLSCLTNLWQSECAMMLGTSSRSRRTPSLVLLLLLLYIPSSMQRFATTLNSAMHMQSNGPR